MAEPHDSAEQEMAGQWRRNSLKLRSVGEVEDSEEKQLQFEDFSYLAEATPEDVAAVPEVRSFYVYDWANSPWSGNVAGAFGGPYITALAVAAAAPDGTIQALGIGPSLAATSYFTTLVTISIGVQLVIFLSFGPMADYGNLKKLMLVVTTVLGTLLTLLFLLTDPALVGAVGAFIFAGTLFVVANAVYGLSVIYYYAYLPLLARFHWQLKAAFDENKSMAQLIKLKTSLVRRLSTFGLFWGQIAMVVVLGLSIIFFVTLDDQLLAYRLALALSGVWWIGWSVWTFIHLKNRPGEPLPPNEHYLTIGWKNLWKTLKKVRRMPQTLLFLISYFVYSDAVSTVTFAAPVLAATELGLSGTLIAVAFIISLVSGAGGALFWLLLNRKCGLKTKYILLINIAALGIVPVWAFVALTTTWEFLVASLLFGFNAGAIQSFSRAAFANFTPRGMEAEMFSLFELSDKGTAWLGPLIVSIVNEATGSFRAAVFAILGLNAIGFILLLFVRFEKGEQDARDFYKDNPGVQKEATTHVEPTVPRAQSVMYAGGVDFGDLVRASVTVEEDSFDYRLMDDDASDSVGATAAGLPEDGL